MTDTPKINLTQLRELEPDATGFVEIDADWLLALIDTAEAAIHYSNLLGSWDDKESEAFNTLEETLNHFTHE